MPTTEKMAVVKETKERFDKIQGAVLVDYRGLTVSEVTELRRRLREANVEYRVLKNTLVKRAAKEAGVEGLDPFLEGPTAIAFGYDDPVSPAKILSEFAKTNDKLEIKAGVLEGNVLDVEAVTNLAKLPGREELLSMVLRGMQGPVSGFVNVLQGTIRNAVYVFEAVRKKKEEAGA